MDRVVLDYSLGLNGIVSLKAEIQGDGKQPETPYHIPTLCEYRELIGLSLRMWPVLKDAARLTGEANPTEVVGHLERIRALGRELREMLLPESLTESLSQPGSPHHIMFRHDPMLNGVPFEHIFVWNEFLCFQRAVGKQLLARVKQPRSHTTGHDEGYSAFAVIDPDGQLRDAMKEDERDRFREVLKEFHNDTAGLSGKIEFSEWVFRRVKREAVAEAVRQNQFLCLACHHIYNDEDPELSGYVLGKDSKDGTTQLFTAKDLLRSVREGDRPPHLLLSACCESGITRGWEAEWPKNSCLYGMVDAVLRIGIPHYIGTVVKIPASNSLRIASSLFEGIASGKTVGESLRQARVTFRDNKSDACDPGTVLGLAFTLYGNPAAAYFCAQGHRIADQVHVNCCSSTEEEGDCGAVVCQKDAGYSKRLCKLHFRNDKPTCSAGHIVDSNDHLHPCSVPRCTNVFCAKCSGAGKGKCWFHVCPQGHEITVDGQRKICPDPGGTHRGEQHTVCPQDPGWLQGLCNECWTAPKDVADGQKVCLHCGRYITDENPWLGVCCDCGRQLCLACGPWHAMTMYCPDSTVDSDRRDKGWLRALEDRARHDEDIASSSCLRQLASVIGQFQASVLTNVTERTRPLSIMPRLSLSFSEIVGPRGRVLRVDASKVELGERLCAILRSDWNAPNDFGSPARWEPPKQWLDDAGQVNRLCVNVIKSIWGRPVLVAIATVVPVEFQGNRGPVMVHADTRSLLIIHQTVADWWQGQGNGAVPDIYLVVLSPRGWMSDCVPVYQPGFLAVLVAPSGDDWMVHTPPIEGMPQCVRSFIELLRPETVYRRLTDMRRWLEQHLDLWDSVTVSKAKKSMEEAVDRVFRESEVLDTFKMVADEGPYVMTRINGKPAIRHATVGERSRALLFRRWIELVALVVAVIGASLMWLFRTRFVPQLSNHWTLWLVIMIVWMLLCEGFVLSAVKYKRRGR